ncbi:hypothetical protein LDENG_00202550 [Lucifuga dentata]|nr:hypothetical protein LDENG_00202550 [Lucifuga dentata]
MENKSAKQAEWFFKKVKLAAAVAVIKSRPAGMSGREHAEALACKLKSRDENWRKKAQELQQEVQELRQELLLVKMTSNTRSSSDTAGSNTMDILSQDLIGPENDVNLHPSCNTENQDVAEPKTQQPEPPAAASCPQPVFPSSHHDGLGGKALRNHIQLLQALCSLQRVAGRDSDLEVQWICPDGDAGSYFGDTVCQLLDSVVGACKEVLLVGPGDLVLQACQVAAKSIDVLCSQQQPSVAFLTHVEDSLRELANMLLRSSRLDRVSNEIHSEGVC